MERYRIKITKQAKEHLTLIRDYIARVHKEPNIAKKILQLLKTEMYSLETMPHKKNSLYKTKLP
ncbi:type II toxin-antitoxin system RelE/ParE family toxin [Atopobacter sp. AH10]|uniref:type II toxin-antitoxin system RelE/ParE family toxin n=1 Tax=Atopobacter sp. AH10 TaxID=2315861 RepID=UPI000EF24A04|nr:type II toxin-antitoxin system RelE/ParE family toxin [Atopobacter sp. AH10]RLK62610.1 type II toxin-antitoxin system RelE/ParE family toxin [Atopobacter sp. AH10]